MDDFELVHVSHCQLLVGDHDSDHLDLYTVGDGLLHVTAADGVTVMTGPHSAPVRVRVEVLPGPPGPPGEEWDAVSEATFWQDRDQMPVQGLMGHSPPAFRSVPVPGPGLLRVQVRARERQREESATEAYEVLLWPVGKDVGHLTIRDDGHYSPWPQRPDQAARSAMIRLVTAAKRNNEPRGGGRGTPPGGGGGGPPVGRAYPVAAGALPAGERLGCGHIGP